MTASRLARVRAIIPGVGACAIWALCNIANKALLDEGVAPLTLLFGQLLVSAPILWLVAFGRGAGLPRSGKGRMLRLGLWQPGLAYGVSFIGLTMTTATVEALLFSVETLLILFFAWLLLGEQPPRQTIAAGVLGAIGVALVAGVGSPGAQISGLWGSLLILAGVVGAAVYSVRIKREIETQNVVAVVAMAQCGGLMAIALVWLVWPAPGRFSGLTPFTVPLIGVSGLFMHSVAFVLFAKQLEGMTASTVSVVLLSIPVMTAALGYVVLGEALDMVQLLGAAIVMGAMLVQIGVMSPAPPATRPATRTDQLD